MDRGEQAGIDGAASVRLALQARMAVLEPSRLGEAVAVIAQHLHDIVRQVRPSQDEYRAVLQFLTDTGHHADARRQEWVLLADALGLSTAIEDINRAHPDAATPNTVMGPFYRSDAPEIAPGASLSRDSKGEPLLVTGRVTTLEGLSLGGAVVEVWQANGEGRYENQEPDQQPEHNLRGKLQADGQGRFRFLTVKPSGYELPASGPVGALLRRLGLPLKRPAHINLRVSAEGYDTLTTHIFDGADPAIDADPIFGVKPALVAEFRALSSTDGGVAHALDLNLVLCPLGGAQPMPGKELNMSGINGYHHLTLSTDGAQEDFDFYTKTLGLHSVKRTVLFDGVLPVYHLYYGSPAGDASTIITTFPFRKPGVYGRRGTNQSRAILQAIPKGAADFWVERLNGRGIEANKVTRFGAERVIFAHPCGIPHELVESDSDSREPITNDAQGIGREQGIKGIYGSVVATTDKTAMDDFLTIALPLTLESRTDDGDVYRVPDTSGVIQRVEVITDRDSPQGTWTLSGGTIHHLALNTGDEESQLKLRAHIEGLGFTDISEQKDRNYFKSCYVRSPGGALFELAWTTAQGWTSDEPPGQIGKTLVFPPWFKDREAELREGLEQADFV